MIAVTADRFGELLDAESRLRLIAALCRRVFDLEDWYELDANDVMAIIECKEPLL